MNIKSTRIITVWALCTLLVSVGCVNNTEERNEVPASSQKKDPAYSPNMAPGASKVSQDGAYDLDRQLISLKARISQLELRARDASMAPMPITGASVNPLIPDMEQPQTSPNGTNPKLQTEESTDSANDVTEKLMLDTMSLMLDTMIARMVSENRSPTMIHHSTGARED